MRSPFRLVMAVAALLFASGWAVVPAKAQVLESYVAFLGENDLYNSRGNRLSQPWQIIRQDRANYHRFNVRDPGDEGDSFFASAANRARMEQLILSGRIEASAARSIINGNVWIRVDIYQNSVDVTVQ